MVLAMETVGQRIKALRRVTGTSQKELGKFCGVSDVAVGYWEKDINTPGGEALSKLAKFFNTSIDYILYGAEFEGTCHKHAQSSCNIVGSGWAVY